MSFNQYNRTEAEETSLPFFIQNDGNENKGSLSPYLSKPFLCTKYRNQF